MMTQVPNTDAVIMGFKGAKDKVGLSRWTITRLVAEGKFPKPIKLSSMRRGWRESVIDAWLDNGGVKEEDAA